MGEDVRVNASTARESIDAFAPNGMDEIEMTTVRVLVDGDWEQHHVPDGGSFHLRDEDGNIILEVQT